MTARLLASSTLLSSTGALYTTSSPSPHGTTNIAAAHSNTSSPLSSHMTPPASSQPASAPVTPSYIPNVHKDSPLRAADSSSALAPPPPPPLLQISLDVPLMKPEQLYPTPSMKDNIDFSEEFDLRLTGCELIQTAGRLHKLPQVGYPNFTLYFQFHSILIFYYYLLFI